MCPETLGDAGNPQAADVLENVFSKCRVTPDLMLAVSGAILPWMPSVTFGGLDLKTVCLGSLRGQPHSRFPFTFRRPDNGALVKC